MQGVASVGTALSYPNTEDFDSVLDPIAAVVDRQNVRGMAEGGSVAEVGRPCLQLPGMPDTAHSGPRANIHSASNASGAAAFSAFEDVERSMT